MLDLVGTQWRENWVYGLGGSAVAVVCLGGGSYGVRSGLCGRPLGVTWPLGNGRQIVLSRCMGRGILL